MWDKQVDITQVRAITFKGRIFFGVGAINSFETIADELKNQGIERFLIVTGKNSYENGLYLCVLRLGVSY